MNMKTTGRRVLLSRKDLGLNQDDLASSAGVTRAYISKIENGVASGVSVSVVEAIADRLQVSPVYLLGWNDDPLLGIPDNDAPAVDNKKPAIDDELIASLIQLSPRRRRIVAGLAMLLQADQQDEDVDLLVTFARLYFGSQKQNSGA